MRRAGAQYVQGLRPSVGQGIATLERGGIPDLPRPSLRSGLVQTGRSPSAPFALDLHTPVSPTGRGLRAGFAHKPQP
jgi:hypothetical protein